MAEKYDENKQKQLSADCLASGMTKKEFCKINNISKSLLYKWLNKFGYKLSEKQKIKLLPVAQEKEAEKGSLEILLPNGVLVRGDAKAIIELVMALLK